MAESLVRDERSAVGAERLSDIWREVWVRAKFLDSVNTFKRLLCARYFPIMLHFKAGGISPISQRHRGMTTANFSLRHLSLPECPFLH